MRHAIPLLITISLIVAACGGTQASSTEPSVAAAEPSRSVAPSVAATEAATPETTEEPTAEPTPEPEPQDPQEAVVAALASAWPNLEAGNVGGAGFRFGGCAPDNIPINDDTTGAFGYSAVRPSTSPTGPTDSVSLSFLIVPVMPAGIMDAVAADSALCGPFDIAGIASGSFEAAPATIAGIDGYVYRQLGMSFTQAVPHHVNSPWFIGPIGDTYMAQVRVGIRSEQDPPGENIDDLLESAVTAVAEALDR